MSFGYELSVNIATVQCLHLRAFYGIVISDGVSPNLSILKNLCNQSMYGVGLYCLVLM